MSAATKSAKGRASGSAPRARSKVTGPFFDERRGRSGRWVVVRYMPGDVAKYYEHHDEEGARRLAGLRPRKGNK
jgi:hypothetical protein